MSLSQGERFNAGMEGNSTGESDPFTAKYTEAVKLKLGSSGFSND